MKLANTTLNCLDQPIGLTIGNFDGVHLGHKFLLDNFIDKCKLKNITPVVITFSPHPLIFLKNKESFLITSASRRNNILDTEFDVKVIELDFCEELQKMSGEEFFSKLLISFPKLELFYAGHDFGLGVNKSIDFNQAKNILKDIECYQEKPFVPSSIKVSSTLIRKELRQGKVESANYLLNRPFSLTGEVTQGNQIGNTLGFPTANLSLDRSLIIPKEGVYAGSTFIEEKEYLCVTNIGKRPTVTNDEVTTVETYILNFSGNLYGKELTINFYRHIRDELKFNSKDELISQIKSDIKNVEKSGIYSSFGLIGKNISHSKSESIYKKLLATDFINYALLDFDNENEITNLKSILSENRYVSVTSPYKKRVFELIDECEDHLKEFECINCIKLENNKVYGTNTDLLAIRDIIKLQNLARFKKILILGDGMMSKLVCYTLKEFGYDYEILSRKNNKLSQLSDSIIENTFIINTCARSFIPLIESTNIISFWDLNYDQPYKENLESQANISYFDGIEMLTLQAKYALSFWNLKTY